MCTMGSITAIVIFNGLTCNIAFYVLNDADSGCDVVCKVPKVAIITVACSSWKCSTGVQIHPFVWSF